MSSKSKPGSLTTKSAMKPTTKSAGDVPIDLDIPDNYVAHTLKTQKPLPPVTWANWYKELNYLSFTILTVTPVIGIIGAMFTPLRWQTFLFAIFYYYVTGLGKLAFRIFQRALT